MAAANAGAEEMSGGRGCRESLRCRDLRRLGALGSQSAVDAQGNISMPAVPLNQPEADRGEMPRLGVARSGGGGAEPDWQDKITACPVFYPSKKEFEDPMSYIRSIAAKASVYGMSLFLVAALYRSFDYSCPVASAFKNVVHGRVKLARGGDRRNL